jgi:hypothetical protein
MVAEEAQFKAALLFSSSMLAGYRGDAVAAAACLAELAARTGVDSRMTAEKSWHLRVSSLVRLLTGDAEGAYEEGMSAVRLEPAGMNTPNALAGCAHAAAWLRDTVRLHETATAMANLRAPWVQRQQRGVEAAICAVEGRLDEAAAAYRTVLDEWSEADLPLDYAWCVVDALAVLPADRVPPGAVERARATLTELEAQPLVVRLPAG